MRFRGRAATRLARRAADVLLWVGAGLGLLSLLAALAVAIGGFVPLVFTSGSMEPEVSTGSLGIARTVDADELRVGDVVSVTNDEGSRVTHRIVGIDQASGGTALTLQGDANQVPDEEPYVVESADRLWFSVPALGRVVTWLSSPWAMFLGGLAAASLLFWAFRRRAEGDGPAGSGDARPDEQQSAAPTSHRRSRTTVTRGAAAVVALACLPALSMTSTGSSTLAAFTDNGTVTTSGFATHRVAQPGNVTCVTSGVLGVPTNLTIGTAVTDPRYTYWVRIFTTAGDPVTPYRQMTGSGSVREYTYALGSGDLPLLSVLTTYHARVFARVGSTSWESQDFRSQPVSKTTALVSCGVAPQVPQITFTQPQGGATYTPSAMDSVVAPCDSGYGPADAAACGNVIDNGSVTNVEYIFQRNGGTLGTRCWTGSLWWFGCDYRAAQRDGTGWSVPITGIIDPYDFDGDYTVTIRATDNEGNVAVRSITFHLRY